MEGQALGWQAGQVYLELGAPPGSPGNQGLDLTDEMEEVCFEDYTESQLEPSQQGDFDPVKKRRLFISPKHGDHYVCVPPLMLVP